MCNWKGNTQNVEEGKGKSGLAKPKEEQDRVLCALLKKNSDLASAGPVEPCPPAALPFPLRPDLP